MSAAVRDPWAFQRWAYETPTGSPLRKSVLASLATMADRQTGRCEARQATIAQNTEMGERTIRRHLTELEEAGLLARRHQYRRNGQRRTDEFLLLAPWVSEWPDGEALPANLAGRTTGQPEHDLPANGDSSYRPQRPVTVNLPLKEPPTGTTPLGPPTGGQQEQDLGGALQLWGQVVDDVTPAIEAAGGHVLQLRQLQPVEHREDGTVVVAGGGADLCRRRFGPMLEASAAQLGVVLEFRTTAAPAPARRQRQGRRRAA